MFFVVETNSQWFKGLQPTTENGIYYDQDSFFHAFLSFWEGESIKKAMLQYIVG